MTTRVKKKGGAAIDKRNDNEIFKFKIGRSNTWYVQLMSFEKPSDAINS